MRWAVFHLPTAMKLIFAPTASISPLGGAFQPAGAAPARWCCPPSPRPLLVAGQPEVRECRMRFWDQGTPNGDWTDVVKVTVSPS
jgi:hypothetical protein